MTPRKQRPPTTYAKDTPVEVAETRHQIETLLHRHGADQVISGSGRVSAMVAFILAGRAVRVEMPLPDPDDYPRGGVDQAIRERWRALFLIIKAKLVAVQSGVSNVDHEFLADVVVPDTGQTVGEIMAPKLIDAYANHPPELLPGRSR